jgi:hypothetical protein
VRSESTAEMKAKTRQRRYNINNIKTKASFVMDKREYSKVDRSVLEVKA